MMDLKSTLPACFLLFVVAGAQAQVKKTEKKEAGVVKALDSVVLNAYKQNIPYLPDAEGVDIFAGKKTNVVVLDPGMGNMSQNVVRTLFAKVPGLNTWDMDGAGTQVNIGFRGTDAHRSIEMNMRQNGYNTNSDIFGYPENHYNPPMQGIQRVQLVRGSAALQYGSQFGGMLNYVMKQGDTTAAFTIQSEQTVGSNNLFNSFNSVGGSQGKWRYYAYYDNRHGDGWRPNSAFEYHAYYADADYQFNNKGSVSFQFSRMDYRQQIAGGLTDGQFAENPRQSFRSRNYFSPKINIPAIVLHYNFSPQTRLQITSHYLFGERSSVQFINTPNIFDTINASTGTYNPRQVDRDFYGAFATEARVLHIYRIGKVTGTLSGGLRYFNEMTKRRQKGEGTTGADFDLHLIGPYGVDLRFRTHNYAAFVENIFQLTPKLSVTPGVRYEIIRTTLSGVINHASVPVLYTGNRSFPLFGTGIQYQTNASTQVYGNISQAYRPYLYANVTPADRIDSVDANLKDSKGYDIDLGYRGNINNVLHFDVNVFYVSYGNRVGQLTLQDGNNANYLLTTNVGTAVTKGVELYAGISVPRLLQFHFADYDIRLFNSLAYNHGRYVNGAINKGGTNVSLKNNLLEGTPEWIERAGITFQYKTFTSSLQFSYVSKSFSDANNTVYNPTGATGMVPAYHVWDYTITWRFLQRYSISGGVNNLGNATYFSRRINMYPGPGILPADGRTFYISMGVKI